METAVLVLNADLGPLPLRRVSLRHAIRMLCRHVAVVHEAEPDRLAQNRRRVRRLQSVQGRPHPAEAGMVLRFKPTATTWASLASR